MKIQPIFTVANDWLKTFLFFFILQTKMSQPPVLYLSGPQTAGGVGVWWIFITACLPAGLSAVTQPDQKGYGAAVWRLGESA